MKKEINFKIIELPTHQVLVSKDFDAEDDDSPIFAVSFFIDGVKATYKFGYAKDSERDKYFNKFDAEQAQKLVDSTLKLHA
jgi:hypothetical protein